MTIVLRKASPEFVADVTMMSHELAALLIDVINEKIASGCSADDAVNITLRSNLTALVAIVMQETGADFDVDDLVALLREVATPASHLERRS